MAPTIASCSGEPEQGEHGHAERVAVQPGREPLAAERARDDRGHADREGSSNMAREQTAGPEQDEGYHALNEETSREGRAERVPLHPGRLEGDHERWSVRPGARRECAGGDPGGDLG